MTQHIKLGQIVHYVSKTGEYECAAIVCGTKGSLYQPNVDAGHLPRLASEDHVHLTVLTPGKPGHVSDRTRATFPFLTDPHRPNTPMGSTYAEWNIEYSGVPVDRSVDQPAKHDAGTWHWPFECMESL